MEAAHPFPLHRCLMESPGGGIGALLVPPPHNDAPTGSQSSGEGGFAQHPQLGCQLQAGATPRVQSER